MNVRQVLQGECREVMARFPAQFFHLIVTSPPYFGLRDYGIPPVLWDDGTSSVFGLEKTIAGYVAHTLELFEAMRRVLRDDGVIFWNVGDTYCTDGGPGGNSSSVVRAGRAYQQKNIQTRWDEYDTGNKLMIPHRVAIALQDAGWIVRSDIVWAKRSPMPESVRGWYWHRHQIKTGRRLVVRDGGFTVWDMGEHPHEPGGEHRDQVKTIAEKIDCPGCSKCRKNGGFVLARGAWRPTTSHEFIFQVTKSERYFCDMDAVAEATTGTAHHRGKGSGPKSSGGLASNARGNDRMLTYIRGTVARKNPRTVWDLRQEGFKGAHFATFPPSLPHKCILAATSSAGCCPECGRCYAPIVRKDRRATRPANDSKVGRASARAGSVHAEQRGMIVGNRDPERHETIRVVEGYRPTCKCAAGASVPCRVFDPFGGSGTTVQVAASMGRDGYCSEINPEYVAIAEERIKTPWKPEGERPKKKRKKHHAKQQSLFDSEAG